LKKRALSIDIKRTFDIKKIETNGTPSQNTRATHSK